MNALVESGEISRQLMAKTCGRCEIAMPFISDIYLTCFHIAGLRYYKASDYAVALKDGQPLVLRREPENEYDKHAVEVLTGDQIKLATCRAAITIFRRG